MPKVNEREINWQEFATVKLEGWHFVVRHPTVVEKGTIIRMVDDHRTTLLSFDLDLKDGQKISAHNFEPLREAEWRIVTGPSSFSRIYFREDRGDWLERLEDGTIRLHPMGLGWFYDFVPPTSPCP